MFSRSLARPLARILLSSSPSSTSFRPSLLPLLASSSALSRSYTGVSSRSSVQTLIHLSLDGSEEPDEVGTHTITEITDKRIGDRVEEGEVLGCVEHTIRTEIVAPCSGNIQRVLFADGDEIDIGEDLFVLQQEDEDDENDGSYDDLPPLTAEEQDEEDLLDEEEEEEEAEFEEEVEVEEEVEEDPFSKEPDGEERKKED
ncbi:hypothetical protein BDY24DRAFT_396466 [Mrakia frigida]|uniref:acetyl-CoA carboxylase biotin carboxyl carrier protein subunit n=1 Tax=Mrakia frigida TaxID=29902 RepID=UPI003FCC0EA6